MKNPPAIRETTLIHAIQQGYGLEITNLEFLLRGFGGDCYRADTRSGISYFLKVHDPVANQMTAASSRDFYLPLMQQLHTKNILPYIPHPRPALGGDLSLKVGTNELVITNFIAGKLVGFGALATPVLAQLAVWVGVLHGSTAELEFDAPFVDAFEIVFEQDLLNAFDILESLTADSTPGQGKLRDIILPRKSQLIADLGRLKALQAYVQKAHKPKVVCHTDLHGANLMVDDDGVLYILDWENALIAPPEHDLFFFVGEKGFWDFFWPRYIERFPAASIDLDFLRFYFYRRALEDIADFIFRILRQEDGPERDLENIGWMMGCLDDLPRIEGTVAQVQARL